MKVEGWILESVDVNEGEAVLNSKRTSVQLVERRSSSSNRRPFQETIVLLPKNLEISTESIRFGEMDGVPSVHSSRVCTFELRTKSGSES